MLRLRPLQAVCGALAASLLLAAPAAAAEWTVNTTADLRDLDPTDGVCESTSGMGDCSLRAAIDEANDDSTEPDTIRFEAGLGTISPGSVLSVTAQVTIDGNGSGSGADDTIVDGGDAVQLFSVGSTASVVTFSDLRLQNGFLDAPVSAAGAALRTDAPATLLDSVVITDNAIDGLGDGRGAGVFASDGAGLLTVENSVISDNDITSDGNNDGAGISSDAGLSMAETTVSGNEISDGTAAQGGGVLANAGLSIVRSTLSNNTAGAAGIPATPGEGGALFGGANPGTRAIEASTISGNSATDSGAGIELNADASITGVTFLGNSGATVGQDLYADAGTASVKNSILGSTGACGVGTGTIAAQSPGTNIDVGTSCLFDGSENQINTNPTLGPLTDNGGPTPTHAPLDGSPAIDMTSVGCGGLALDQRLITRPQGTLCDVGAVEVQYRLLTASKGGSGVGTIASAPTGISCGGDCTESYLPGASVTLTATPSPGSVVGTWSGCDSTAGNQCTVALGSFASGADRLVTASFEPAPPAPPGGGPVTPPAKKKCKKGQKLKKGKCVKKKKPKKKK